MKQYVITGGSGFLGSRFVQRLLEDGHTVTVFDNLSTGHSQNLAPFAAHPKFRFVNGDITDMQSLRRVLGKGVDAVFHLSAVVGVKAYCSDPLRVVDVNVLGTRNVLTCALAHKIKVVFASTSEIFGKNPNVPWKEDDDRVLGSTGIDRWSYSTSKAMCEHMILALCRQGGLDAVIVRFFNVYGPGQPPYFVISQTVQKVLRGERPLLYDSGRQTRCFTFVDDAVEGALRAARSKKGNGEVFNIGSSTETTVKGAVELIITLAGKEGVLTPKPLDTKKHYGKAYEDIPRRVPDIRKAKRMLGFTARTSLKEGLKKTIEWSKENHWWLDLEN